MNLSSHAVLDAVTPDEPCPRRGNDIRSPETKQDVLCPPFPAAQGSPASPLTLLERDHHLIRAGQVILGSKGFAPRTSRPSSAMVFKRT
jgi:hypothetical protein